jgi:hypothetical protein
MRIFLDSSTLQTLQDYGDFIFENRQISPDRLQRISDGQQQLESLHLIFRVAERAPFEFALSNNSLSEVAARGDSTYLQWAYDVLDHWYACIEGYGDSPLLGDGERLAKYLDNSSVCGYLSAKDRRLIRDAVQFECDAFLTMEKKLPKNASDIQMRLGLTVLRPLEFAEILKPWVRLFL